MNYYYFIEEGYPEIVNQVKEINNDYFGKQDTSTCGAYTSLFHYADEALKAGTLKETDMKKIMDIVENTIISGSHDFQEAAVICFLEDLSNGHYSKLYDYAKDFIGKHSKIELENINAFWRGENDPWKNSSLKNS